MQNDTRDPTQHTTAAGSSGDAAKEVTTSDAGPASEPGTEKIDGPGPKPIAEVAKEHGGDAGNCNSSKSSLDKEKEEEDDDSSSSSSSSEDDAEKTKEEKEESKRRHEQRKKNKKGTGEIYIKSSGLKADGGDFDASRAGAGREADRKSTCFPPHISSYFETFRRNSRTCILTGYSS